MTIKDAYLQIGQGLQTIEAFVSTEIQKAEIDLCWNNMTNKFIQLIFMSSEERVTQENVQFQEVQATLDDLRNLQVKDTSLATSLFNEYRIGTLPNDYLHLLDNSRTIVTCGSNSRTKKIRLLKSELLETFLDSTLFKTNANSPIGFLNTNQLFVYFSFRGVNQFSVTEIIIDYLKKPAIVAYGVNGAGVLELPDATNYKIIKMCIIYLSSISSQDPNKINNIKNVST